MDDAEHEQFQDDSDVEISDLPGENAADSGVVASPKVPHWPFQRPASARQRALQLTVIISVVALTLLIILGSFASVRDVLIGGIFGRALAPTPTLAPGTDLFYIEGTPSWGRVSIDGRALSRLPTIGIDPPFRLTRGRHKIEWRADPFQPQSCTVSVPRKVNTDTCLSNTSVQVNPDLSAWIIWFSVSLNLLPDMQRIALTQVAQAALDTLQSTETVQPGEQYVDVSANNSINTAVRPLHGTLRFQLDTNPTSQGSCVAQGMGRACVFQGTDCRLFCTVPGQGEPSTLPTQGWDVFAVMSPTWKYTTLDGRVVASNQPDSMVSDNMKQEYLVKLHITWDAMEWHVTIPRGNTLHVTLLSDNTTMSSIGDPACASALDEIVSSGGYYSATGGFEPVDLSFVSGPNSADGCLAVETPHKGTLSSSSFPVIYILHRFGIILAANDVAHHYLPLPLADTYEQKLAQQLATLQPP